MPLENPFFSIVTVVRNDISGLKSTLESINSQVNKNYEWIVIDGASSDGCVQFLENSEFDYLQWISEPDTGIYQAMNKGIRVLKGKYVVFLNAGDLFANQRILKSVYDKLIENGLLADVLIGGATLFMPGGSSIYREPKDISYIWQGLPSNHQATYFKGAILKSTEYDESYRISGDYYLIAKLFKNGISTVTLDEPLVIFRIGDLSFKSPKINLLESDRVQNEVLNMSIPKRVYSTCRKIVSISILNLLVRGYIPKFILGYRK